ncbi:hypothetical protein, partial [Nocardia sp. CC213A]
LDGTALAPGTAAPGTAAGASVPGAAASAPAGGAPASDPAPRATVVDVPGPTVVGESMPLGYGSGE